MVLLEVNNRANVCLSDGFVNMYIMSFTVRAQMNYYFAPKQFNSEQHTYSSLVNLVHQINIFLSFCFLSFTNALLIYLQNQLAYS